MSDPRSEAITAHVILTDFNSRTAATLDALMVVRGAVASGLGVTYLRLLGDGEPPLPDDARLPDGVRLVESWKLPTRPGPVSQTGGRGGLTVVEVGGIPPEAMTVLAPGALVVGVGETRLDVRLTAAALARLEHEAFGKLRLVRRARPGERGHGYDVRTREAIARGLVQAGVRRSAEVLDVTVPCLAQSEADALVAGSPPAAAVSAGMRLLGDLAADLPPSVRQALKRWRNEGSSRDGAPWPPPTGIYDESGTLRSLADDLEAIAGGTGPTASELADAPILKDWDIDARMVRSLSGLVDGHPRFPLGRRVRTSELFATDGRTWARTMSRYYRLGPRRPVARGVKLH